MLFIEQLRSMMDIAAAYLLVRYLQKSYSDSLDDEMNLCFFFAATFPQMQQKMKRTMAQEMEVVVKEEK